MQYDDYLTRRKMYALLRRPMYVMICQAFKYGNFSPAAHYISNVLLYFTVAALVMTLYCLVCGYMDRLYSALEATS